MRIEPRYWLVEFAASFPRWLGWLAAWLINREADRLESLERKCVEAIGWLASRYRPIPTYATPDWAMGQLANARPGGIIPYQNAAQFASLQNAMAAQAAYANAHAALMANNSLLAQQAGLRPYLPSSIGGLLGIGYGGGGSIP